MLYELGDEAGPQSMERVWYGVEDPFRVWGLGFMDQKAVESSRRRRNASSHGPYHLFTNSNCGLMWMYVPVCVCACARACLCVCVCA